MKRTSLIVIAFFSLTKFTLAQNTFPPSGGNVGIGTTSPNAALQVVRSGVDASTNYPAIHITTTGTGNIYGPVLYLNASSGTSGRMWGVISSGPADAQSTGSSGNFAVYDATASAARMIINNYGNVGIGTITPTEKLVVNGNIQTILDASPGYSTKNVAGLVGIGASGITGAKNWALRQTTELLNKFNDQIQTNHSLQQQIDVLSKQVSKLINDK